MNEDEIKEENLEREKRGLPPLSIAAPAESQPIKYVDWLNKQETPQTNVDTTTMPPLPEMPKQSDYEWNQQYFNKYFETPLTPQERARRERVAYISSGVSNLGKAIGALGNMFVAQHGAPAQEAVKVQDVNQKVDAFRERADKVRDAYLNARKQDRAEYMDAYKRWLGAYNARAKMYDSNQRLAIMQAREDRLRLKDIYNRNRQEALARKDDAQAKYWEAKAAGADSLTDSQVRANIALEAQRYASAAASNANANLRNVQAGGYTDETTDAFSNTTTKKRTYNTSGDGAPTQKKPLPTSKPSSKKPLPTSKPSGKKPLP